MLLFLLLLFVTAQNTTTLPTTTTSINTTTIPTTSTNTTTTTASTNTTLPKQPLPPIPLNSPNVISFSCLFDKQTELQPSNNCPKALRYSVDNVTILITYDQRIANQSASAIAVTVRPLSGKGSLTGPPIFQGTPIPFSQTVPQQAKILLNPTQFNITRDDILAQNGTLQIFTRMALQQTAGGNFGSQTILGPQFVISLPAPPPTAVVNIGIASTTETGKSSGQECGLTMNIMYILAVCQFLFW
ncbi:hypothetical protein BC833DRAFT_599369 [Globomyces pollinis-pini]|nr:hypothetical protein BC833DRAFT_599369 [Globomyces pollinis-pini]